MPISSDPSDRPKKQKPLSSDTAVKSAGPGWHTVTDAPGLILRVHVAVDNSLTRTWIVRLPAQGRRRPKRSLGQYPVVTLGAARQKAVDAHRSMAAGNDPGVSAKRRQRAAEEARSLTLAKAIEGSPVPRYKNPKSHEIRERALRVHFAPLHSRDVAAIATVDVANILRSLKPQTAIKTHTAIRAVFDYAATMLESHGVTMVNPADPRRLRSVGWSPQPQSESESYAAVHWTVMPEVVAELGQAKDAFSACALFIAATAARVETACLTKWANIDFAKRLWTPPLGDLKDGKHHKRPFIVPINDIALDALERMRGRSSSRFVFAKSGGGAITGDDITNLTRRLRRRHPDWLDPDDGRRPFTVHGFRSALRTFVEETRRANSVLGELSLGHSKVHGEVATRYIRTGLVEERRALLEDWGRHLSGAGKGANVVAFPRG